MDKNAPVTQKRVNRSPMEDHRRQMRWQVWAPLIASIVVFLACVILTVLGAAAGSSEISRLANISTVWVILPMLLVGFFFLVIFSASVYGMILLLPRMPEWLLRAQLWMEYFSLTVKRGADAATEPVMSANSFNARVNALWRRIRGKPVRKTQTGAKV